VITFNVCLIPGPSYFHSSNLCLYPTIHSSLHLLYLCIRTFPSAPSPVDVYTRAIPASIPLASVCIQTIISMVASSNMFFVPSTSLICSLSTPVFVSWPSSTRHLCTVFVSRPSSPFPLYHVFASEPSSTLHLSTVFVSRPFPLFPLYHVFVTEQSSPRLLCTVFLSMSFPLFPL
jgi:hypothetical protein